jgi:signal transduction histidine kinase
MSTKKPQPAAAEIAEKLAFLEQVVDAIDQGFAVWDENEVLVYSNRRFIELWDYPPEMVHPGTRIKELIRHYLSEDEEYSHLDEAAMDAELEVRHALLLKHRKDQRDQRFTHHNGREIYVRRYFVEGLGNVVTYMDISNLQEVEREVSRKSGQLKMTLDAMDQGVVIWGEDDDLKLELCNERFLELWDYPEEFSKPGRPVLEFLEYSARHGEFGSGNPVELARSYMIDKRHFFREAIDDLHTTRAGKTLFCKRRYIEGFGSVSTFTDVSALKKTEDDLRETQAQLKDQIEQLKHREAELEGQRNYLEKLSFDLDLARSESVRMNEEKDRLFSILAHDLLSPFNAIIGFSSLLKLRAGKVGPEKIIEAADAINESATGLHQLLANLLEWSRTQMEGTVVDLTLVQLHEIAQEVRELFLASAEQKGVSIINDIQPVALTTDRNMIAAVLRNLVSNAVKFTPRDGTVVLSTVNEGDQAVIGVTDTGIGIPADQIGKVFSLEKTESLAGTQGETGTGLGLRVCKDFVEQLGGTISIDSKPGAGTGFRVVLPVAGPDK